MLRSCNFFESLVLGHLGPLECLLPIPQIFAVYFHLRCSECIQEVVVIDETGLEEIGLRSFPRYCKHGVPTLSDCQPILEETAISPTYTLALIVCQFLATVGASRDQSVCP